MSITDIVYSIITGIELLFAVGIVLHILHHYTGKDKVMHSGYSLQLLAFTITLGSVLQLRPPSRLDLVIFLVGYILVHWPKKK